jgi:hypothetical protein
VLAVSTTSTKEERLLTVERDEESSVSGRWNEKHDTLFEDEQLTVEVSKFADSIEITSRQMAGHDALVGVIESPSGVQFLHVPPSELDLVIERVQRRDDP